MHPRSTEGVGCRKEDSDIFSPPTSTSIWYIVIYSLHNTTLCDAAAIDEAGLGEK